MPFLVAENFSEYFFDLILLSIPKFFSSHQSEESIFSRSGSAERQKRKLLQRLAKNSKGSL